DCEHDVSRKSEHFFLPPNGTRDTCRRSEIGTRTRDLYPPRGSSQEWVNSVAPGWMLGPPVQGLLERRATSSGTTFQNEYDKIASEIPLGRIPTDEDCAGVIVFLASDLSAAMT